jgi:hypothetical protein
MHYLGWRTTEIDPRLAKRKMIVQNYGTPGGPASAHAALLSDVSLDGTHVMPTRDDCSDKYDDNEVSVPFTSVAFPSSLTPGLDMS